MNYLKNILLLFFSILLGINLTAQTATISGNISSRTGEPMSNVSLTITTSPSSPTITTSTDDQGNYSFEDVSVDGTISIVPSKDTNPLNGVSTFDIVLAFKHALGLTPFDSADAYFAMDVNQSGSVTALDMVMLRQLILNLVSEIPGVESWRFVEATQLETLVFNQSNLPEYNANLPDLDITPNADGIVTLNFIGIKVGDASGNANAGL